MVTHLVIVNNPWDESSKVVRKSEKGLYCMTKSTSHLTSWIIQPAILITHRYLLPQLWCPNAE